MYCLNLLWRLRLALVFSGWVRWLKNSEPRLCLLSQEFCPKITSSYSWRIVFMIRNRSLSFEREPRSVISVSESNINFSFAVARNKLISLVELSIISFIGFARKRSKIFQKRFNWRLIIVLVIFIALRKRKFIGEYIFFCWEISDYPSLNRVGAETPRGFDRL